MEILQNSKLPFESVEYLNTPPSEMVLDRLLLELKMEPQDLVRKGEDEYVALASAGKLPQMRKDWIKLMVEHPILIERPIVSNGVSAVIGRPPSKVSEWLDHINQIV